MGLRYCIKQQLVRQYSRDGFGGFGISGFMKRSARLR